MRRVLASLLALTHARLAERRGFFELHMDLQLDEGQVLFVTRDYRIDEDVALLCAAVAPTSASCPSIAKTAASHVLDRCLYLIHLGTDDGKAACKWVVADATETEASPPEDDLVALVDAYDAGPGLEKYRHYFEVYERHLAPFRRRSFRMLEIGVADGGSSVLWRSWLGPGLELHCADINPRCVAGDPAATTHHGDQADPAFLARILAAASGALDVVVDDGGHGMRQQIGTFEFLYPRLAAGGVYVVEDCHTSYWPSFGGDGPRSFMEFVKRKMDALHYFHLPVASDARARLSAEDVAFARETKAISVFESVVVFEKRETAISPTDLAPVIRGSVFTPGVGQRADSTAGIGYALYDA